MKRRTFLMGAGAAAAGAGGAAGAAGGEGFLDVVAAAVVGQPVQEEAAGPVFAGAGQAAAR